MSIPILIVVLEIWSTRSSSWTPSCSWQYSPWRPPPTRPLASCYCCHYTQWSPQNDGIKIRALVVELLHLKERGQKSVTNRQTNPDTHLLLRPLPYGRGLKIVLLWIKISTFMNKNQYFYEQKSVLLWIKISNFMKIFSTFMKKISIFMNMIFIYE